MLVSLPWLPRSLTAVALSCVIATPAGAQVIDLSKARAPTLWVSGGLGYLDAMGVTDGRTQTHWDFDGGIAYRVGVERPIRSDATLGLVASFSRHGLRYRSIDGSSGAVVLDANADLWSLLGTFRIGGGSVGLHQVIEIVAGAVQYDNFRSARDGNRLPPHTPDIDPAFGVGYGFGYAFGPGFHLTLVQDFSYVMHQREGLGSGAANAIMHRTTRLALRRAF